MKTKHIIIGLIILVGLLFFIQQKEHAGTTNTSNLSNEAVQNIAKVYADTNSTAVFNNIRSTGKITGNVTGNLTGNVAGDVSGSNINISKLCIGKTCIDETDLQKVASNKKCAGFAVDGTGTTMLLYEGYWKLYDGNNENERRFDAWTSDAWDVVYIFKGWKIQFWADEKSGKNIIVENKTDDIPKGKWLNNDGLTNQVSSYEATWVGY